MVVSFIKMHGFYIWWIPSFSRLLQCVDCICRQCVTAPPPPLSFLTKFSHAPLLCIMYLQICASYYSIAGYAFSRFIQCSQSKNKPWQSGWYAEWLSAIWPSASVNRELRIESWNLKSLTFVKRTVFYNIRTCLIIVIVSIYFVFLIGVFCLFYEFWSPSPSLCQE